MKRSLLIACIACLGLVALATGYAAYLSEDNVIVSDPVMEDFYVAGETVQIDAEIQGDLAVAGQNIRITGPVQGDLFAGGESVRVEAPVDDDARLAGRTISIDDRVTGHLIAAGETVRLGPNAEVGDWAWLAGRNISIQGRIGADSRIAGQTVTLSGLVQGNLSVHAAELILTPSARVEGDLTFYSSAQPQVAGDAVITGDLKLEPEDIRPPEADWGVAGGVFGTLLMIATVVVLYLLFPGFLVAASDNARTSPFKSMGLGLLLLLVTPLVVLLLFITGVGILLGVVVLMTYLLMLLAGSVTGQVFLAAQGLRLAGKAQDAGLGLSAFAVALAVIVVQLVQWLPVVGGLVVFLLFLLGLGAAWTQLWRRYKHTY